MNSIFIKEKRSKLILNQYRALFKLINKAFFFDKELTSFIKNSIRYQYKENKNSIYVEEIIHSYRKVNKLILLLQSLSREKYKENEGIENSCIKEIINNEYNLTSTDIKQESLGLLDCFINLTYGQNIDDHKDYNLDLILEFELDKFEIRKEVFIKSANKLFSMYVFDEIREKLKIKKFKTMTPIPMCYYNHIKNDVCVLIESLLANKISDFERKNNLLDLDIIEFLRQKYKSFI